MFTSYAASATVTRSGSCASSCFSTDVTITAFSKMVDFSLETPEMLQKAYYLGINRLIVRCPTRNQ